MNQDEITLRTRAAFQQLFEREYVQSLIFWEYVDAYKAEVAAYNQWSYLDSTMIAILITGSSDSENLLKMLKIREDDAQLLIHCARVALLSLGYSIEGGPTFQEPFSSSQPGSPDTPRRP